MEIETKSLKADIENMPADMRAELETVSHSRRDFMKVTGMAGMAAVIAGCTAKDRYVKPFMQKPEGITPGVVYNYASTCQGCATACGITMKVRDGRPIKLEGAKTALNQGGLCAKGQAALWNLYHPDRLQKPMSKGEATDWATLDAAAGSAVKGGGVWLLSGTISGRAALAAIKKFCDATGARHVQYDAISSYAIAAAHKATHGVDAIPHYQFANAKMIVSFDADFLGTWISPVEFAAGWARNRDLTRGAREMSRHIQVEARYSQTGANADERFQVPDSQRGAVLVDLANRIAGKKQFGEPGKHDMPAEALEHLAEELQQNKGKALVISGSGDVEQQKLINWINHKLGAYDTAIGLGTGPGPHDLPAGTINLATPSLQARGNDAHMAELLKAMEGGNVKTLILYGVNPVYDLPEGEKFKGFLSKVGTTIAITSHFDETASECAWVASDDDPFERWNDFEPVKGMLQLAQPGIRRLYETRHGLQSLLLWAGDSAGKKDYREFLKNYWEANILGGRPWTSAVEAGVVDMRDARGNAPALNEGAVGGKVGEVATGEWEIVAYENINVGDGRHAGNGWLQENADPMTRTNWGNYVALSPAALEAVGVKEGDIVSVTAEVDGRSVKLDLPAVRQPGQHNKTAAIALGYGRTKAGRIIHGMGEEELAFNGTQAIGANAFPLLGRGKVVFGKISAAGGKTGIARIQEHDSQEGRPILKETTLPSWKNKPTAGNDEEIPPVAHTLWKKWEYKGHKWEMVVDLNSCMGCNACVVACNIENNIPIVGKKEVLNRREMHWIRIDVYYDDESPRDGKLSIHPNPGAGFQPIMCQHCENAPCETVCPVLATVHSEEGLNTQAYNRCIGTRYCANNCPYKVRRFNWFTYKHDDLTMNLALNPDLTIRSQGIMEKCSMCTQRLYEAKREAARHGQPVTDGMASTACQSSCPTQAITVGDANDKDSRVAKLRKDPRNYQILAEINTRPGVTYLTKVRNVHKEESHEGHKH